MRDGKKSGESLTHARSHTRALTHAHTHTLSLSTSLSRPLSLDLSHSLSPSLSFCSTNATTTCHHETTLTNAMTRLTSLRRIGVNLSKNCPTWSNGMPAPFLLSLTRVPHPLELKPRVLSIPLSTSQPLSQPPFNFRQLKWNLRGTEPSPGHGPLGTSGV